MFHEKTILCLGAHPDDVEHGMGGTLAKLNDYDCRIYLRVFSQSEISNPGFDVSQEMAHALSVFPALSYDIFQFPTRHFPHYRQDILESLVVMQTQLRPDIVFVPHSNDCHQDHQVITQEAIRAFKRCTIFGYRLPWNLFTEQSQGFIALNEWQADRKVQVLQQYISQREKWTTKRQAIEAHLRSEGAKIHQKYAESFEVIRWII